MYNEQTRSQSDCKTSSRKSVLGTQAGPAKFVSAVKTRSVPPPTVSMDSNRLYYLMCSTASPVSLSSVPESQRT